MRNEPERRVFAFDIIELVGLERIHASEALRFRKRHRSFSETLAHVIADRTKSVAITERVTAALSRSP